MPKTMPVAPPRIANYYEKFSDRWIIITHTKTTPKLTEQKVNKAKSLQVNKVCYVNMNSGYTIWLPFTMTHLPETQQSVGLKVVSPTAAKS